MDAKYGKMRINKEGYIEILEKKSGKYVNTGRKARWKQPR
jgi:hypothetical protein